MKKEMHNRLSFNNIGIPLFDDERVELFINRLSLVIYEYIHHHREYEDMFIMGKSHLSVENYIQYNKDFSSSFLIEDISIKWLNNLLLVVDRIENDDEETSIMGKTGIYFTKYERQDSGEVIETDFSFKYLKYDLYLCERKFPHIIIEGNQIKLAAMRLILRDVYSEYDIQYIVRNQLTHLYNIVFSDTNTLCQKSIKDSDISLFRMCDKKEKTEIIKHMTVRELFEYFETILLDINFYAIHPYLKTIAGEIIFVKKPRNDYKHHEYERCSKNELYRCSKTYRQFRDMMNTFELLKRYVPFETKIYFAKEYIDRLLVIRNLNNELGHILYIDFLNMYNEYTPQSFDDFCDSVERMINNSLSDIIECYNDCVNFYKMDSAGYKFPYPGLIPYRPIYKEFWFRKFYQNE